METKFFSENNSIGLIVLSGISLMFLMGIVLLVFFYFSKKKIVQKELEKQKLEIAHQKKLFKATLEAQEKERKRIARDLHDDISSKLNIVSLNCDVLSTNTLSRDEQKEILKLIISLSGKALDNTRHIAHNLFPPVFDEFGLDASVEELCDEFTGNTVKVTYTNNTSFNQAHKNRHLHVFRILQELMNNSVRHGKAKRIEVVFEKKGLKNICKYYDDGKGFDLKNLENQKGLGMKNIQNRVSILNGTLSINSKINQGTSVIFSF